MAKYTIDLGPNADKMLSDVAKGHETTKADIIRRALATYVVLQQETMKGHKLIIRDEQNNVIKELLPV